MSGLVDFLNANAGAFTVIFSAVVALATVVYAVLTWRLVAETSHLRREQTDAFVVVAALPNEQEFGFIDLVVRNDGQGTAHDVTFAVEESNFPELEKKVTSAGFFKNGLPYFPANQEIRAFLTEAHSPEKAKARLTVAVTYRTSSGVKQAHSYPIALSVLENVHQLGTPFKQSVPKRLEQIVEKLEKIAAQLSRDRSA
jgi:hypothetical protein